MYYTHPFHNKQKGLLSDILWAWVKCYILQYNGMIIEKCGIHKISYHIL